MPHFCPQCGQPVTELDAIQCPYCGASLAPPTVAPAAAAASGLPLSPLLVAPLIASAAWNSAALPPLPQLPPIPFEAAPGFGSFLATVKAVLTHPIDTLQGQRTGEGLFNALAFFLIIQIPAQVMGQLWNWSFHQLMPPQAPIPPGFPEQFTRVIEMFQHPSLAFSMTIALAAILLGLPFVLINAGVIHFFLRLLGGGKEGYGATVKALCYSCAPMLLALIPFCGSFAGGIWAMILQFVLVGAAHREPPTKGVLAVLFYYLAIFLCTCGAVLLMMFAIVGSAGLLAGH